MIQKKELLDQPGNGQSGSTLLQGKAVCWASWSETGGDGGLAEVFQEDWRQNQQDKSYSIDLNV